jgi:hypothetical protein
MKTTAKPRAQKQADIEEIQNESIVDSPAAF